MTDNANRYPPALQRLVPPKWIADEYVNRKIHGIKDFEVMEQCQKNGTNILVEGSTQIGKTRMFEAYAAAKRQPFLVMTMGGAAEYAMMFGKDTLMPDGKGAMQTQWVDGVVTLAVRYGHCVFLWDEANTSPPGIFAALHQLAGSERSITLLDHLIPFHDVVHDESGNIVRDDQGNPLTEIRGAPEVIRAAPELLIGIAINPVELGYAGTDQLSQALIERCDIRFEMKQDPEVVEKLVGSPTLRSIGEALSSQYANDELESPCSVRKLMKFEQHVEDFGLGFACSNFVASFEASDQDVVKNVLDLHMENLTADYLIYADAKESK